MGTALPKQFLEVAGRPIILRTIDTFYKWNPNLNIVVVMNAEFIQLWDEVVEQFGLEPKVQVVEGGRERFHSVQNGLKAIKEDTGVIAIHDAVRPFVSEECIERCVHKAREKGNAIPVVSLVESIRQLDPAGSSSVDRSQFRIVQTPQCFDAKLIQDAYQQEFDSSFTDDASVAEKMGIGINLVDGNVENIKITNSSDLAFAEMLVS